jgi:hypothetical protein
MLILLFPCVVPAVEEAALCVVPAVEEAAL